jgi:hypothetical protein
MGIMDIEKERVLKLSDNQTVSDEASIDQILAERRLRLKERMVTSPVEVLAGIDFSKATLVREERNPFGVLEINYGGDQPYQKHLLEIPDLTIDLTPKSENLPRECLNFRLVSQGKEVTIDVLYHQAAGEYWEHYGDYGTLYKIVEMDLWEALQEENWQFGTYNAWLVAE